MPQPLVPSCAHPDVEAIGRHLVESPTPIAFTLDANSTRFDIVLVPVVEPLDQQVPYVFGDVIVALTNFRTSYYFEMVGADFSGVYIAEKLTHGNVVDGTVLAGVLTAIGAAARLARFGL